MDLDTFWYYTRWHHAANRRRYRAPATPRRLVDADPSDVEHYTNALPLTHGLGRVRGGDWDADQNRTPLRETDTYRGLRERFEDGRDWVDTALYAQAVDRFDDQPHVRGYESIEAFRETRLPYLDDLHDAIATEGYRANAAAAEATDDREAGHVPADADNPFETAYANRLEPLVVVARDGEFVWIEGYHRFAVADLLDLDAIPVQVLARHERWQRVRDAVARDGVDAADLPAGVAATHPDLADVVDD
ncbi:hypothetical protein [Halorubellus salinus]|uniref:hypothetical protein n=1 Tax=Halorubellus salinus TaxID=755309 RepID=UPI001D073473|nr:hypothetical protein [Halorubellus salinus]